ncbi:RNA-directed DNA polymerase from mobile element jockey [Trichonephila clavipes]|nr:RNA-directed DNA polymerase from mobile element jockey [Trichonephila clavipes]
MNPSLPVVDTASPIAQVIKGRDRGLGKGPWLTSELRSPTGSLKILQCNINGLSTPATRTKLEQLTLQTGMVIYRTDRPYGSGGGLAFLVRDLNYKKITLPSRDFERCRSWDCSTNNDRGNDLLNADDDRALIFLNSGLPTRTSFSYGTSEALDITLVSPELHPHCDWDILSSIGSDHLPILINVQINRKIVTSHDKFWNFKKANWDCFQRITEGSFDKRTTMDNLEQEWKSFKQVIIHVSKQSIPRGNFKHLKSYFQHRDPGLRTLILKRNALHRKLTLTGDREDKVQLNKLNASIKQLYIKLKREAWSGLCSNIDAKTSNTKL